MEGEVRAWTHITGDATFDEERDDPRVGHYADAVLDSGGAELLHGETDLIGTTVLRGVGDTGDVMFASG